MSEFFTYDFFEKALPFFSFEIFICPFTRRETPTNA